VALERTIHFLPPHIEKMRDQAPAKIAAIRSMCCLAISRTPFRLRQKKRRARVLLRLPGRWSFRRTGLWTRVNALNSPWFLDDVSEIVAAVGNKLDVIMVPKVEGPWDIHFVDQFLALLEARHQVQTPILIHAILETAEGVKNVDDIARASPRMHGMSLGPADLAASRGMKTTRVGGGHPSYGVLADRHDANETREFYQQDLWHYTVARMVDACLANGIRPFYGPFGDFQDDAACEAQFRNAYLQGCVGAWTLHPSQIDIAKRVFSPEVDEVSFARRILDAMPDGAGAVMIDGKMQDDATWKQAKVIVDLAEPGGLQGPRACRGLRVLMRI
jgi:malyl-CoA/(S)-citramalyl-CoA lyase